MCPRHHGVTEEACPGGTCRGGKGLGPPDYRVGTGEHRRRVQKDARKAPWEGPRAHAEGGQQGSGMIRCVGERQPWRQRGDRWGTAGEGEGWENRQEEERPSSWGWAEVGPVDMAGR